MKLNLEEGRLRYVIIALLALIPYMQTVKYDFALDDSIFITKSKRVQRGLKDIPSLFENKRTGELEYKTGYRPILLLSYATDVEFFGMNPKAMHAVNILIYALLCLLILKVLTELFPENRTLMFWVALLFTVHPLHVEGVANIKGRDELLAMLFGMLFIWAQVRYMNTQKFWWLIPVPFLYLLAILSKESAITFAGAGLALVFFGKGLSMAQRTFQGISSVTALGLMAAVRAFVYSDEFFENKQQELEQLGRFHWDGFIGNPLFDVHDFPTLLANGMNIIYQSVKLFFIPHPLVHDYSFNHFPVVDWGSPQAWAGLAIVIGGIVFIILGIRKRSPIAYGLMWFFATISVYLSIVRPATDIFAERFLFTPSLGLSLVVLTAISSLTFLKEKRFMWFVGGWSAILVLLTVNRCPAWKDTETLMKTDIENLDDCVRANFNYALLLHQRYDNEPRKRNVALQKDILLYYHRALKQSDRLANLYQALGSAYMRFGMPEKALPVFWEACAKYPDLVKPFVQVGTYYFMESKYDSAVYYFSHAIEAGKINSDAYMRLGLSYYHNGEPEKAIETFQTGAPFANENVEFFQKYITLCIMTNNLTLADQATQQAYRLFPNDLKILDYHQQFEMRREKMNYFRK